MSAAVVAELCAAMVAAATTHRVSPLSYVKGGMGEALFVDVVDARTGERIAHVLEADSLVGWYRQYRYGPDGKPVVDRRTQTFVIDERRHPIRIESRRG